MEYIHEEATVHWRELEDRLHEDYRIKGVGIKASRKNLKTVDEYHGGFLHTDEALFPGEVPSELQSFPYRAAAAAYSFTILEGYGDEIVNLVNPGYLKARQAWHHGVYGDANFQDKQAIAKARKGFCTPFGVQPSRIPLYAVKRLVDIKAIRNEFAHEGSASVDFNEFFANVTGTVASIFFALLPAEKELSLFPYYDYTGKWK
jgi:hypothetical protein